VRADDPSPVVGLCFGGLAGSLLLVILGVPEVLNDFCRSVRIRLIPMTCRVIERISKRIE
jgi:hypothetical protein